MKASSTTPLHCVILGVLAERGELDDVRLFAAVRDAYEKAQEAIDVRDFEMAIAELRTARAIRWRDCGRYEMDLYRLAKPQAAPPKACAGQKELFE